MFDIILPPADKYYAVAGALDYVKIDEFHIRFYKGPKLEVLKKNGSVHYRWNGDNAWTYLPESKETRLQSVRAARALCVLGDTFDTTGNIVIFQM